MTGYSNRMHTAVKLAPKGMLGVRMGAICIDAQIPVQVVARWMGVTRQGVYFWFTGETEVAERHQKKVERIIQVLTLALDERALPAKNLEESLRVVDKYRAKIKTILDAQREQA